MSVLITKRYLYFSDRQFGSVSNVLIVQQAICSPQQKKRKKKEKEEDK